MTTSALMTSTSVPAIAAAAVTRSQAEAANVRDLLKARNTTLWVVTSEEARVEAHLAQAAAAAGFMPRFWDCAAGVTDLAGNVVRIPDLTGAPVPAIDTTLTHIAQQAKTGTERGLWVLRDAPAWLQGPIGINTIRQVRNLARSLPAAAMPQAIVILTPSSEIPPELMGHMTVVTWPMPDRAELAAMLDSMAERYKLDLNGARDAAIDAAVGLSGEEAESCYARSLVKLKRIDPAMVAQEKKSVIAKAGLLEWMEPLKGGFDAVGGLDVVKAWVTKRKLAYTPAARAYGLPAPRGIFLAGISGCGKSLIAKAIACALGNVPLIRLDLGALQSKYVGESQNNLRKALAIIAAIGRCVVLVDEIEKALAGATQGAADGGVSADALGTLLTWMQERTTEAFLVATANDITSLPPEMLRKGRWDELFWVDLPTRTERVQILQASLRTHGRAFGENTDWNGLATATDTFTGAEIAALVPDAMFAAFADDAREVDANDIVRAARDITPLAETAKDKIAKMRDWAKGKARPATSQVVEVAAPTSGRNIDL